MPIKPQNKHRYPKDWKQIRERILSRAGHCCEWCRVPDKARITRGAGADADTYMDADANVWCANTGEHLGQTHMSSFECNGRWINVVLTIAHLDHQPENRADDNLRALCQRCHLKHDRKHHAATARATRHARRAIGDLFADDTPAPTPGQTPGADQRTSNE